ncbi:hypothetical protein KXX44_007892, partial [Aspergillus fumigatus]
FIPGKLDTTFQAFDERICKKGCIYCGQYLRRYNQEFEKCAADGGETNLCQDQKAMQAIGTCLKENMMPMALGEMEQLSMFITTDMCDKMNAYLKGRSFGKLSFLKC